MSEKTAYVFREISIKNKYKQMKKAIDVSDFVSDALQIIKSQAEAGFF